MHLSGKEVSSVPLWIPFLLFIGEFILAYYIAGGPSFLLSNFDIYSVSK